MAEEEVLIEVEAAESVYGDDCIVLEKYPPHLHLLIKPRTAEVSSQQFVEAVIGIQANSKYPDEPPAIVIIDSKGLDDQRQKHLITSEAMEKLTSMNHPDGDCPLCLSPLVEEGASDNASPFMKLMSACIIRWWNWLQTHKEVDHASSSGPTAHPQQIKTQPVCRKVFHAKDIEHVLDLVGAYSQLNLDNTEGIENEMLLRLDSENTRRQKFEAILKLQQENNGLIEPKKTEVLMPGMFLPRPTTTIAANATSSDKESATGEQASESKTNAGVSSNSSNHRRSGPRSRYRGRNSRTQVDRRWIVKENGNAK
ncbi:RWD domain-containing protein [Cynara cardunculus var. scolymus]|uniref:RWD domain-containing protein n=1 Tax=Cynara cardunculus var. scolymus TaxID=59895 RepID=A0A118JTY4_CYNCS|nr:RWD domain-containing protein [Cynara cardunculus var. scolymus]